MRLGEIACFTPNPDRTIEFYERLLNKKSPSKSREFAEFMIGETKLMVHKEVHHVASKSDPQGGSDLPFGDHIAFAVDNVDEACRDLAQRGVAIDVPARDYYWGRSAYLKDPDGRWLELHQARKA